MKKQTKSKPKELDIEQLREQLAATSIGGSHTLPEAQYIGKVARLVAAFNQSKLLRFRTWNEGGVRTILRVA